MPPNKSKPGQGRPRVAAQQSSPLDNVLAQQLRDALDLTRSLSKSLQDEVLLNVKARTEMRKDIEHLCESVDQLKKIMAGNGQPSLEVRLLEIEHGLERLQDKHDLDAVHKVKRSDRFWRFLIQNTPLIFTWIGLAIWAFIQFWANP